MHTIVYSTHTDADHALINVVLGILEEVFCGNCEEPTS